MTACLMNACHKCNISGCRREWILTKSLPDVDRTKKSFSRTLTFSSLSNGWFTVKWQVWILNSCSIHLLPSHRHHCFYQWECVHRGTTFHWPIVRRKRETGGEHSMTRDLMPVGFTTSLYVEQERSQWSTCVILGTWERHVVYFSHLHPCRHSFSEKMRWGEGKDSTETHHVAITSEREEIEY